MAIKTLDKNGSNDIYMSGNTIAMAYGTDAQSVIMDSLILTQRGEIMSDENIGIDYFGTVFQSPTYIDLWAGEVRTKIRKLPWVKTVKTFKYEFDREHNTVNWEIEVINEDDEHVWLNPRYKNKKGTSMELKIDWTEITNKPKGIQETIDTVTEMRVAAGKRAFLGSSDSLGVVKSVVNEVVLTPLKAPR